MSRLMVCEHGSLRDKCELCERDEEIARLRGAVDRLQESIINLQTHCQDRIKWDDHVECWATEKPCPVDCPLLRAGAEGTGC